MQVMSERQKARQASADYSPHGNSVLHFARASQARAGSTHWVARKCSETTAWKPRSNREQDTAPGSFPGIAPTSDAEYDVHIFHLERCAPRLIVRSSSLLARNRGPRETHLSMREGCHVLHTSAMHEQRADAIGIHLTGDVLRCACLRKTVRA